MSPSDVPHALAEIEARFSGRIGVAAKDLAGGETVEHRAGDVHPLASVLKLPVLVELLRQAQDGRVDLHERIELVGAMHIGGSGVLKELGDGLRPTLRDLAVLMTIVSDNIATNVLLDRLGGVEAVNRCMRDLGLSTIVLHGPIDFEIAAASPHGLAEGSCRDLMRLMELLVREEILDRAGCRAALDILRAQQLLDQAPRYLDYNPWAQELGVDQQLDVASKTGLLLGMRMDVGAIWLGSDAPIVYAITAQGASDLSVAPENEATVAVGLVARALAAHWSRGEAPPILPTAYAPEAAAR